MNIILAVTTYNRLHYISTMIESWKRTADFSHHWTVLIADDGSTDNTLQYINDELHNINHIVIHNKRRGVHCGTNKLFKMCLDFNFEMCFKTDDDIEFIKSGWDNLYIKAIQKTGYQHLVFHDTKWEAINPLKNPISSFTDKTKLLECRTHINDLQGAFFTITPDILSKIGFFDTKNFGPCGFGHVDYTLRCCKAGFNDKQRIYDASTSTEYIKLNLKNYSSAPGKEMRKNFWNVGKHEKTKKAHLDDSRVFVCYNEPIININNKPVMTFLTAGNYNFKKFIRRNIISMKKLGYSYHVYDIGDLGIGEKYKVEKLTSKCIHKPKMILEFINKTSCEYVIYIDADMQILKNIDEIIYGDFNVGVSVRKKNETECAKTWSYINAGIIVFKNNNETIQFIKKWHQVTQNIGDDQLSLSKLINPKNLYLKPYFNYSVDGVKIKTFPTEIYNHYYIPFNMNIAKCVHYCRYANKHDLQLPKIMML